MRVFSLLLVASSFLMRPYFVYFFAETMLDNVIASGFRGLKSLVIVMIYIFYILCDLW